MSDVLQDAEAIQQRAADFRNEGRTVVTIPQDAYDQLAPRLLLIGEYEKILPELIKEIKRLRSGRPPYTGSLQDMLTDFREEIEDQSKDIIMIAGQLAKWKQAAIEERARRYHASMYDTRYDDLSPLNKKRFMEQAAKELGLEQDASYIGRLETAYLLAKEESLWANHDVDDIVNSKQRAQAALAKIREGK